MAAQVALAVAVQAGQAGDFGGVTGDDQDYVLLNIFILLPAGIIATPIGWIIPGIVAAIVNAIASKSGTPASQSHQGFDADREFPADWASKLYEGRASYRITSPIDVADGCYRGFSNVLPPREDVFRAFHLTPLETVRAVIIGQDPYPRLGDANGLAFSQDGTVEPGSSLAKIFSNLEADPHITFSHPRNGDLTAWARQGVLLMNTSLTTTEGNPRAHISRWREFSDAVVKVVRDKKESVVFICFGREAVDLVTRNLDSSGRHHIIAVAHPAAHILAHSSLPSLTVSRPFSEANAFLLERNRSPIDWQL